jgi:hypothetical protein
MKPRSQVRARPLSFVEFVTRLGVSLTPAQMTVALVAFDGIQPKHLPPEYRKIARKLFGDVDSIPASVLAIVVAVVGARSGKSYILGGLRLLHLAWTIALNTLAPGEVATGLIVAPDLRLARQCLRFVIGALENSNLTPDIVGQAGDSVTIRRPDGRTVVIECLPATRGGSAVRGRSLVGAVLDECAFFRDSESVVNDVEVFTAVTPRILPGGQTILASTPWASVGLLHDLFRQNWGHPVNALAIHAPTSLMRDYDPAVMAIIERERSRDPQNAKREYDAEFTDLESTLIPAADVLAATDDVKERPYRVGLYYGCTVDVGLRNDSTAILLFHVEARKRPGAPPAAVLIVDAIAHLVPRLFGRRVRLDEVDEAIGNLCEKFHVTKVHGDMREEAGLSLLLRARGLEFVEMSLTLPEQEKRARALAGRFSSGTVRLVSDATLTKQVTELRVKRRPGGGIAIEGRGKHDDAADTLLLAADVATTLPMSGGDIVCDTSVFVGDGNVQVNSRWRERHVSPDGSVRWTPSSPPVGSAEWVESRRELAAEGVFPMNEPDFRPFANNDFK